MKTSEIYEVKSSVDTIAAGQTFKEVQFRGANNYGKVLGFNVYLTDANGTEINKDCLISAKVVGDGNRTILSPVSYRLVKHAKEVSFLDRFISVDDVKGHECDFAIAFQASENTEAVKMFTTVLYSKK